MATAGKVKAPRDYISPSDLTFLWGECRKCFWLKYNEGISRPGFMPLVGPMASLQEKQYRERPTSDIGPGLPPGVVTHWGESVESVPLMVDGKESRWRVKGKYDIVATFDNGHIALIDCKVTTSEMADDKVDLYWPQLEAYAYALENPLNGQGKVVAETGLLMWRVVSGHTDHVDSFGFGCEKEYLSAGRRPALFQGFIAEVIKTLDGPLPESGEKCTMCKYAEKRNKSA